MPSTEMALTNIVDLNTVPFCLTAVSVENYTFRELILQKPHFYCKSVYLKNQKGLASLHFKQREKLLSANLLSLVQSHLLRSCFAPDTELRNVPASQEHSEMAGGGACCSHPST